MKIINDVKIDFNNVLIKPKRSKLKSRSEVNLIRKFSFPHSIREISCIPIIAANMDTTGSVEMSTELSKHQCLTALHKHYAAEYLIDLFSSSNSSYLNSTFYSTGISDNDLSKLYYVYNSIKNLGHTLPNLCIDVANGYSEHFVKTIRDIRRKLPDIVIMAGNVVTPEMTEELILHGGVDIVKVGIGSGSVCTTRLKTGVGYPQLSAIMECSDAAHGLNGHICSDGGCTTAADVCKAFGGNADFVMLGGMLAGTDCCEGEWEYEYLCQTVDQNGNFIREWWQVNDPGYDTEKRKKSLKFYGMSSKEAMQKHNGGVANYRTSEGRCVSIPYKGTTEDTIKDILGGLRSACTYIGSESIKDFSKKTTFIQVHNTHNKVYSK